MTLYFWRLCHSGQNGCTFSCNPVIVSSGYIRGTLTELDCMADTDTENQAWIYRWLIVAVCLLAVLVAAVLVVVVIATRHRRRSRDRRFDDEVELQRRQEKYFNTLRTTNCSGYYNWTYDPTDVCST